MEGLSVSQFNVISLFSGCGGSSLGYQQAGGKILTAIEYDLHAVKTYRDNFPDTALHHADIRTLDPELIMKDLNLEVGELDILDGSPPCQGFSTIGKREVFDPRNLLFKEYVRFLNVLQPKAFVMENVTGLIKGQMKPIFITMIKQLEETGYTVRARVLNASHYGVPQRRERVIILGVRNDIGLIPSFPEPSSLPRTFKQALAGLKHPGMTCVLKGKAKQLATAIQPTESGATVHSRYQNKPNDFSLIRLSWHQSSPTVCKTVRPGQCGLLHPEEDRFLGINELKRVCGFPDDFKLSGTFEEQWGRLGNAVPPALIKAVSANLIKLLEQSKQRGIL